MSDTQEATPTSGIAATMKISLSGVLDRAAEQCARSRDVKYLSFALRELNKHLEMVRDDRSRVDEFFDLYEKH
jgi:hypothetical protein